jgi:hypothetical protein
LNFFAAFFFAADFLTAINSPDFLLRFVQAVTPPSFVLSCVRFFTAPLRALSPNGLLTATMTLLSVSRRSLFKTAMCRPPGVAGASCAICCAIMIAFAVASRSSRQSSPPGYQPVAVFDVEKIARHFAS